MKLLLSLLILFIVGTFVYVYWPTKPIVSPPAEITKPAPIEKYPIRDFPIEKGKSDKG